MYNKARQWPFQMTAGLQPVQLVLNYQHRLLTLKFSIKHELQDGLVEPLMSQTVWQNRMGNIKQVAFNTFIWPVSGLVGVVIQYDKDKVEISAEVVFRVDTEKISTNSRVLAKVGLSVTFNSPTLEYAFSDDKSARRCG